MNAPKYSDSLYLAILRMYQETESIAETAKSLHTSTVTVRKVLITEGMWSSKTSETVQFYLAQGKTTAQIAQILCTTEKAVQQYLPYTKGLYRGDVPSISAVNSASYRARIATAQENAVHRQQTVVANSSWTEPGEENDLRHTDEITLQNDKSNVSMKEILHATSDEAEVSLGKDFQPKITVNFDSRNSFLKKTASASQSQQPIYLHLELLRDNSEVYETTDPMLFDSVHNAKQEAEMLRVLRSYGGVKYGETIARDILVPAEMPLWALHYAIQKCFGWQNSHLHSFELPDALFQNLTGGNFSRYAELIGILFRSPWMDDEEAFWNDDYEGGSFRTWLQRKYTGPYESLCYGEGIWQCQQDVKEFQKKYRYCAIEHSFDESGMEVYGQLRPITKARYEAMKATPSVEKIRKDCFGYLIRVRQEAFRFEELPLTAMRWDMESAMNQLLERLSVGELFAKKQATSSGSVTDYLDEALRKEAKLCATFDEAEFQPRIKPVTDTIYYRYDFGDDWIVKITAPANAADLIAQNRLTEQELKTAMQQVQEKQKPVCIAQDGRSVLDDVGGMHGFIRFLRGIHLNAELRYWGVPKSTDEENIEYYIEEVLPDNGDYNAPDTLDWAKSLGWSMRRCNNKNLL